MIDEKDFDQHARDIERLERELAEKEKTRPRDYTLDEFRYDAQQGGFWNLVTGAFLNAKGVDVNWETDTWETVPRAEGARGAQARIRPSSAIMGRRATVVEDSTWVPGMPQIIHGLVAEESGLTPLAGHRLYNAYRAPSFERSNVSPQPWIDLVKAVFPVPEDHDGLFDVFSHMVQKPGEKCGRLTVLSGEQGCGKDSILLPVKYAVGLANSRNIAPDTLFSDFTSFHQSVMLVVDEVRLLETDHKATALYEKLKVIAVAPPEMLPVNRKKIEATYVVNVVRGFVTTNSPQAMFIPAGDRRIWLLQSPCNRFETVDVTAAFWKAMEANKNGLLASIYWWLRDRDISKFIPSAEPPMTAMKAAITSRSGLDPDSLASLVLLKLGVDETTPKVVFVPELIKTSKDIIRDGARTEAPLTVRSAALALTNAGYVPVPPVGAAAWYGKFGGAKFKAEMGYRRPDLFLVDAYRLLQERADRLAVELAGEKKRDLKTV